MTDPGHMKVLLDDLHAHAGKIDGVVDQLSTAADAAKQVTMPNGAYGILCQPFALLLDPVEQHGVNTLEQAVQTMTETAQKVRETADTYRSTEDGNDQMLKRRIDSDG